MNIEDLPKNTHLPRIVADGFVQRVTAFGYKLDYSLELLFDELEKIFEDTRLANEIFSITDDGQEQSHNYQNGLASYLGETFVQLYKGQWQGFFSEQTGMNFYTSSILFGEFTFRPFAYVGYRIKNGVDDTGNLIKLVSRIEKSMQDGINYKNLEKKAIIAQSKIAVDSEPWS